MSDGTLALPLGFNDERLVHLLAGPRRVSDDLTAIIAIRLTGETGGGWVARGRGRRRLGEFQEEHGGSAAAGGSDGPTWTALAR